MAFWNVGILPKFFEYCLAADLDNFPEFYLFDLCWIIVKFINYKKKAGEKFSLTGRIWFIQNQGSDWGQESLIIPNNQQQQQQQQAFQYCKIETYNTFSSFGLIIIGIICFGDFAIAFHLDSPISLGKCLQRANSGKFHFSFAMNLAIDFRCLTFNCDWKTGFFLAWMENPPKSLVA